MPFCVTLLARPSFVFSASAGAAATSARRLRAGRDVEQLDVEDEHPRGRTRLALVRELLGDPEAALLADDHQLDALGPPGDHAAERQRDRLRPCAPGCSGATELSNIFPSVVQPV